MSHQYISLGERLTLHTWSGPETTNTSMCYILVPLKCFEEHGRYLREKKLHPFLPTSLNHGQKLSTCTEQQSRIISFETKGCIISGGWNQFIKGKTHHKPVRGWGIASEEQRAVLLLRANFLKMSESLPFNNTRKTWRNWQGVKDTSPGK